VDNLGSLGIGSIPSVKPWSFGMKQERLYGMLAEFENADSLIQATQRTYDSGYRKIDATSPYPVEGLAEALGFRKNRVPLVVLLGGLLGGLSGYALQYFIAAIYYPINIGGRPMQSTVPFIVITFELTVLGAALAAVLGMLALNGLPMPYHPLFNTGSFQLASRDRFFLVIESSDPKFEVETTRQFLESLNPHEVCDVPR
jgi:hypothetical protein